MVENVIIIGGGPAGLAAALYTSRANLNPLLFAGFPPGGQLMLTTEVENYPGFESILGPNLIEMYRKHVKKFAVRILDQNIIKVDFSRSPFILQTAQETYQTKAVIIATGAKARWLGLESEIRLRGKGVSACATCDGFFFKNKVVAVVGGGDTAMEEVLTLTNYASQVYIIHRRDQFRCSKIMAQRVLSHPKIHIIYNAQVEEVIGDLKVEGVKLRISPSDRKLLTKTKEELEKIAPTQLQMKILEIKEDSLLGQIPLEGLFIAIGHRPDTDIFKGQINIDKKGYILTFSRLAEDYLRGMTDIPSEKLKEFREELNFNTQTSTLGVFAAGDCVDYIYRQAGTAVGMGIAAALEVERWLELSIKRS